MSGSHTPGPWHIFEKEAHKGQGILHIVEEGGDPYLEIATLMAHKEELEANARLMAAAPEMLEALEDVKIWLEESKRKDLVPVLWVEVCAAIAKARGES